MHLRTLLLAILLITVALPASAGETLAPPLMVRAVSAIGITVSDMDRAVSFYQRVLAFEKMLDVEVAGDSYDRLLGIFGARMRIVRMRLGRETVELTEFLTPRGRPVPADSRSQDRWFQHIAIIVRDMGEAWRWLRERKVELISPAPQRLPDWNPHAGGIEALYFRDPDGHPLEVLRFPPGKGDARWHEPGHGVFMGIDHTAIVVSDTDRSLRFYRDTLGLRVVGESENWGPEQERLNNVFGARLRITTLRAPTGPAVELLEYLTPRDGRPRPAGTKANDLIHWHTALVAEALPSVARAMRAGPFAFTSPGIVAVADGALGFRAGMVVGDPDGHALQLRAD